LDWLIWHQVAAQGLLFLILGRYSLAQWAIMGWKSTPGFTKGCLVFFAQYDGGSIPWPGIAVDNYRGGEEKKCL
jgi:hypothetical protein